MLLFVIRFFQTRKFGTCVPSISLGPCLPWTNATCTSTRLLMCCTVSVLSSKGTKRCILSLPTTQWMPQTTRVLVRYKLSAALAPTLFFCSSTATIDVKRNIYDLALAQNGFQLALVENQGQFESVNESSVRIYDIGRHRHDDDEVCFSIK